MITLEQLKKQFTINNMIPIQIPKGSAGQNVGLKINSTDVSATYLVDLEAGQAIALLTDKGNWYLVGEETQTVNQSTKRIIEYRKTRPIPQVKKGNIKILFSLYKDLKADYYIGGDRIPVLLFSRDVQPELIDAYISNLGKQKNQFAASYFVQRNIHSGVSAFAGFDPYNRMVFNYYSGETNYFYTSNVEPVLETRESPSIMVYRGNSLVINVPGKGYDNNPYRSGNISYPVNAIHLNNKAENTSEYIRVFPDNIPIGLTTVNYSYSFIDTSFVYNTKSTFTSQQQNIIVTNKDVFYKGVNSIITEDINLVIDRTYEVEATERIPKVIVTDNTIYKFNNSIILNRKPFIITRAAITDTAINLETEEIPLRLQYNNLNLTEDAKASVINTEVYLGVNIVGGGAYLIDATIESFSSSTSYNEMIISVNRITIKKSLSFGNYVLFSKNYSFLIPFILGEKNLQTRDRHYRPLTEINLQSSYTIILDNSNIGIRPGLSGYPVLPLVHAFNPELFNNAFDLDDRSDYSLTKFQETLKNISMVGNKIFYSYITTIDGKMKCFVEQWDIKSNGDVVFNEKIIEVPIKKITDGARVHSIQYFG